MIVKANMGGNWLWGLMILKSLLKQMSSVAIGRNGSNLSYGKVTWFFYLSVFQVSYNDYEPYILGFKELQMLWQLNFSWKIYTLRWGLLLLIYLVIHKFWDLNQMYLESSWEFSYLLQKKLKQLSIGLLVMRRILTSHCICGCLWIGNI